MGVLELDRQQAHAPATDSLSYPPATERIKCAGRMDLRRRRQDKEQEQLQVARGRSADMMAAAARPALGPLISLAMPNRKMQVRTEK